MCIFRLSFWKKGWKVMNLAPRDVFVSRHVLFEEHVFPFKTTREENSASPPPPLFQPNEFYVEFPTPSSRFEVVPTPAPRGASTTDPPFSEVVPDTVSKLVPNPAPSNRSQRVRRAPAYLQDFICHTTCLIPGIRSSGTRFPLALSLIHI